MDAYANRRSIICALVTSMKIIIQKLSDKVRHLKRPFFGARKRIFLLGSANMIIQNQLKINFAN